MNRLFSLCTACLMAALISPSARADQAPPETPKPIVQLAILLDTSNSMDGLINQAKTQLWTVVNEFATAKYDGQSPDFQVALYEYGNDSLDAKTNFIRQVSPLTDDLDLISEKLFALKTNGGSEYCGAVINVAVRDLAWSDHAGALKAIFIAGNEPFTQGPQAYTESCAAAIKQSITVNTIFCGPEAQGVNGKWQHGAQLADGTFLTIDQNATVVHIDAPQDQRINELNAKLNDTYIPYGRRGAAMKERQEMQDSNAAGAAPSVMSQRAVTKSNALYNNTAWDLVDASEEKDFDVNELKKDELPENMREMTDAERTAYVEAKAKERAAIQQEINELAAERDKYVAAERQKLAEEAGAEDTAGDAMIEAVHRQGAKNNWSFQK